MNTTPNSYPNIQIYNSFISRILNQNMLLRIAELVDLPQEEVRVALLETLETLDVQLPHPQPPLVYAMLSARFSPTKLPLLFSQLIVRFYGDRRNGTRFGLAPLLCILHATRIFTSLLFLILRLHYSFHSLVIVIVIFIVQFHNFLRVHFFETELKQSGLRMHQLLENLMFNLFIHLLVLAEYFSLVCEVNEIGLLVFDFVPSLLKRNHMQNIGYELVCNDLLLQNFSFSPGTVENFQLLLLPILVFGLVPNEELLCRSHFFEEELQLVV